MIARETCVDAFRGAVAQCDLETRVAGALDEPYDAPGARFTPRLDFEQARAVYAIAVGKGAFAMARGLGPVARGIAVAPSDDQMSLPPGWTAMFASHPEPNERSLAAGVAVRRLVEDATDMDRVVALISGGASALIESPLDGTLHELRATTHAVMAAGAPIDELNTVRGALSAIKAGKLAELCAARMITFVASDVIGDPLDIIGSGPTIGPWLAAPNAAVDVGAAHEQRRRAALAILTRYAIPLPRALAAPIAPRVIARDDRAVLVAPMRAFADAMHVRICRGPGTIGSVLDPPYAGDVADVARRLASMPSMVKVVAYGEPTLRVPPGAGVGGRAQHLALLLARAFRDTDRSAFVVGTDGIDGPASPGRLPPAGAYVDGKTWSAIARTRDPDAALARCDSGTALDAVNALVFTGPTGVNHADIAVIG